MRAVQIQTEGDPPKGPTSKDDLAVSLIAAALIGVAFVATGAWVYFLYLAAWQLFDWLIA